MRGRRIWALVGLALILTGCWDKLEVEDQLFPSTIAIDQGERSRYKVVVRMPIPSGLRSGILGGRSGGQSSVEMMSAEADTIAQAMYIINTSTARAITLRHLRGVVVGEKMARKGVHDLLAELSRNGEIRETAGFWVARGSAIETVQRSSPTAEFNGGKINEGLLLVEKRFHMAPPIRLHHMLIRRGIVGVDPIAPLVALNARIQGEHDGERAAESAMAGEMDRTGKNPMEIAGTAVFRDNVLVGFLTVDETQALLALRGELGKAYLTIPAPDTAGGVMMLRFQQENKPQYQPVITPTGPRVTVRLIFEGEVLSGTGDYKDPAFRQRVETVARDYMVKRIRQVLARTEEWQADPVGFGVLFRPRFATWAAWSRYNWRSQLARLQVKVDADMRIRRFGIIHSVSKGITQGE